MRRLALTTLLLCLAVAAPAAAASNRAQATRLIKLERASDKVLNPIAQQALQDATDRFGSCPPTDVDEQSLEESDLRSTSLLMRHTFVAVAPQMRAHARRLERFKARNRTVRRAARSMAVLYRAFVTWSADPPDICTYFDLWRQQGWSVEWHMDPPPADLTVSERTRVRKAVRALLAAARHFRHYGVRKSLVKDFKDGFESADLIAALPKL